MIYVVKVTANQEKVVAEMIAREAVSRRKDYLEEGKEVYSVLYTTGLKGYILVEADKPGTVEDLAMKVPKTKGLLLKKKGDLESAGTVPVEELQKTLVPTPMVENVNKGDLIELIAGPFKGEKARVARIDTGKNEITVELIEAAVPIPVIVRGEDIKILKKEESE
ncbi:MAG: transcription elongation factor Spt5 [Candidatus Altiarchaeota archaeon]|nr:transcription elongation factor Spt5 [Candidatus Altiarchaeota archaeon]